MAHGKAIKEAPVMEREKHALPTCDSDMVFEIWEIQEVAFASVPRPLWLSMA